MSHINRECSRTVHFFKNSVCSACWDLWLGLQKYEYFTIHVICCAVSNRNIFDIYLYLDFLYVGG
jgi:hypothetical protein